jgi:V8-like Glu-specific endopeptidase
MSELRLKLDGPQFREFYAALQSAFTEAEMTNLLPRRLQREITDFGSPTSVYQDRLYRLVGDANNDGWAGDLLREVRNEKSADPALVAFAMKLQPPSTLEAAVTRNSEYVDWNMLDQLMRWVCRISCGDTGGTGLLIGPDFVVTNSHVIREIKAQYGDLQSAVCIFDHRKVGQTEEPGRPVALDPNWTIPERPWNEKEGFAEQHEPDSSELDYAILRLAAPVGNEPTGDPSKALPGTPARGWLNTSVNFKHHRIELETPITVIQHPKPPGLKHMPMCYSVGILKESPWPIRIRYNSITDGGSSGSPCFNFKLDLIAIHHATDQEAVKKFNQGVPMRAIIDDLKSREKLFLDQGATPPWKSTPTFVVPASNLQPVAVKPENALVVNPGGAQ